VSAKKKCCCCDNETGCTGEFVHSICTSAKLIVPQITALSGGASGSEDYSRNLGIGGSTLAIASHSYSVTFDAPALNAFLSKFDPGEPWIIDGYYVRSGAYEFDGLANTGISVSVLSSVDSNYTASAGDPSLGASYDLDERENTYTDGAGLWDLEEWFVRVEAETVGTPGLIGVTISVLGLFREIHATRRWKMVRGTNYFLGDPAAEYRYALSASSYIESTATVSIDRVSDGFAIAEGASETETRCTGDDATFALAGNFIFKVDQDPTDEESFSGSATMSLADTLDEDEIGCKTCERAYNVSGTWSDLIITDGSGNPIGSHTESATFTGRLVQQAVASCGTYKCIWTGPITITSASWAGLTFTATLAKLGPSLWRLFSGNRWSMRLQFDGDCPGTGIVAQDVFVPEIDTDSLESERVTILPGGSTTFTKGSFDVDEFDAADATITGYVTRATAIPAFGAVSSNAVTFTPTFWLEGDPDYYCDCPIECVLHDDLLAVLVVDGVTSNVTIAENDTPCQFTGHLDTIFIDISRKPGKFVALVYDSEVGEAAIATLELPCDRSGTMVGTYTRTDGGAGTITLSVTP